MKQFKYLFLILFLAGCAGKALENAQKANYIFAETYNIVSDEWVKQIVPLKQKMDAGTATDADMAKYDRLKPFGHILSLVAEAQHSYNSALLLWKATGEKPANLDSLLEHLSILIKDMVKMATELGFKVPVQAGGV
jgi:hypothetical protein